jgi:predicted N-acetyltransferase YhbS
VSILTLATDDQLESIFRESWTLWGSGLTYEDYVGLWRDLRRTTWGRRNASLYVWLDARGRVLSSMKVYRPRLQVAGRTSRATVIGALFTPRRRRRRGHASALMRAELARAKDRGDAAALLFSDIGAEFYAAFDFRVLPAEEDWARLPADPQPPPGWLLRPASDGDGEPIRHAHEDSCRLKELSMVRDDDHWRFLEVRSSCFFERLGDRHLHQRRQVALERGRFAGYLVTVECRDEWNVREVGAPGGDEAAMAAILRCGAAQARQAEMRDFYAWLPPGVRSLLGDWSICTRRRRRAVPMAVALDPAVDLSRVATPEQIQLSFQDQF